MSSAVASSVEHVQPDAHALPLPMHMAITSESDLIEMVPRVAHDTATANTNPSPTPTPNHKAKSRTSTRAKPYEFRCRYCHRTFQHRSRIVEHVRKHSPQLKLPCTSCDIKFTSASTLTRHIRLYHQPKPTSQPDPHTRAPSAPSPAVGTAGAAAASVSVPVSSSASASACVPFDVVDVVQVYPPPGRQLSHVNSIVFTATVRRSDCLPHLNGQRVVYKSINPAQNSQYVAQQQPQQHIASAPTYVQTVHEHVHVHMCIY
jgi:hypothetical protein